MYLPGVSQGLYTSPRNASMASVTVYVRQNAPMRPSLAHGSPCFSAAFLRVSRVREDSGRRTVLSRVSSRTASASSQGRPGTEDVLSLLGGRPEHERVLL